MGDRRQARELALQALFFLDMTGVDPEEGVEAFCLNNREQLTPAVRSFFLDLVQGVLAHSAEIDGLLNKYSKNWKTSRMPAVDRNIMRMATFEFLKRPDIPASVTINEAVEIGKKYGSRESGAFINGVLDRLRSLEKIDEPMVSTNL